MKMTINNVGFATAGRLSALSSDFVESFANFIWSSYLERVIINCNATILRK